MTRRAATYCIVLVVAGLLTGIVAHVHLDSSDATRECICHVAKHIARDAALPPAQAPLEAQRDPVTPEGSPLLPRWIDFTLPVRGPPA